MREYIQDWLLYLESANPFLGIPIVLLGLSLMFMGWHFQKAALPFIFVLIGVVIGDIALDDAGMRLAVGVATGLALAVTSYFFSRYAVSVLAGLCGAFVLSGYLTVVEGIILPESIEWALAGFGFVAAAAMAFISFREMVMIVTSFVGSLFLILGMSAILPQAAQPLYNTVTQFLHDYPAFLIPFLVGSPTLIGTLIQMSNANRGEAGAT